MRLLTIFFFLGLSFFALAQPGPPSGGPPGGGGGPPCGTPPCNPNVPLGGIEILIAAGAAFGAQKWYIKNKKN